MLSSKAKEASEPAFKSVMETIRGRLDAITQRDLIYPERKSEGGRSIGRLSSEQKKLWTLMMSYEEEIEPLVEEANRLAEFLQSEFGSVATPSRIIAAAHKKEVQDAAKRIDELHKFISPCKSEQKIVRNIFWNDVRTMLDCWGDGHLFIEPDWSVSIITDDEFHQNPLGGLLSGLMRRR